jgi:peptide/nickel transport system permease protein
MRAARAIAYAVLAIVGIASLGAGWLAPAHYAAQDREAPGAGPSPKNPLGTDDLGRDRLSRLLYGSRISLLLAPAAAGLATLLAALLGTLAGALGGWVERVLMSAADLMLSLPWLFLLLTVRAVLPLNVSPVASMAITFLMLGCLGWAAAARVVRAGVKDLCSSGFTLMARATGCSRARILFRHVLPNLRPVLLAQFWISVPVFLLTEANLGLLGLGVAEPLPSWGGQLRELENFVAVAQNPWILAPAAMLLVVVSAFQFLLSRKEFSQ